MQLIALALEFATKAHESIDQRRKGSGEPYIEHPVGVMQILKGWGVYDETTLALALLHDTVEDTPATLEEVAYLFGEEMAALVDDVTNRTTKEDGPRAWRAAVERDHLAASDYRAQTVKLADMMHNTVNIMDVSPHFAGVWLPEKIAEAKVLTKTDPVIRALVIKALEDTLTVWEEWEASK